MVQRKSNEKVCKIVLKEATIRELDALVEELNQRGGGGPKISRQVLLQISVEAVRPLLSEFLVNDVASPLGATEGDVSAGVLPALQEAAANAGPSTVAPILRAMVEEGAHRRMRSVTPLESSEASRA